MTWVRDLSEPPVRRRVDAVKLVCALGLIVLTAIWSEAQTQVEASFFAPVNQLTDSLQGVMKAVYALGSPWALGIVVLAFLVGRRFELAARGAAAGLVAWGAAELVQEILG